MRIKYYYIILLRRRRLRPKRRDVERWETDCGGLRAPGVKVHNNITYIYIYIMTAAVYYITHVCGKRVKILVWFYSIAHVERISNTPLPSPIPSEHTHASPSPTFYFRYRCAFGKGPARNGIRLLLSRFFFFFSLLYRLPAAILYVIDVGVVLLWESYSETRTRIYTYK